MIIAHAIAKDLRSYAEKGHPLTHTLHANWDSCIKSTKKINTVSHSLISKSPYCYSRKHPNPLPVSQEQSLLPARIRQPRDAMHKHPRQVFPTATPTTDLRPYDKICAHLHRLHNRIKASVNRD